MFHSTQGFSANSFTSGNDTVYFFKTLKAIDSLTRVTNFLFREFCLRLLFKFKIGPSLNLSCLMSSMFIIIRIIIRIIKTTCFKNTVLMAELEGMFP